MERTRAFRSQSLTSKMKSLIWGTGRHVDRTEAKGSSTKKRSEKHSTRWGRRGGAKKEQKKRARQKIEKIGKRRERMGRIIRVSGGRERIERTYISVIVEREERWREKRRNGKRREGEERGLLKGKERRTEKKK